MGFTLEITGKTIGQLVQACALIPPGTAVNIPFLGTETHAQRLDAARILRDCGFAPVPILSARRLLSRADAAELVGGYVAAAAPERFICVGGDPAYPQGPYPDSMALMESGLLAEFGIRKIGIVAYPENHPDIPAARLWDALLWKRDFLGAQGVDLEITTQLTLDPASICAWLAALRARGVPELVRIGICAPAPARRLLGFARQFGAGTDPSVLAAYGLPAAGGTELVDPLPFLTRLRAGLEGIAAGAIGTHVYPFGGLEIAAAWAGANPLLLPGHEPRTPD